MSGFQTIFQFLSVENTSARCYFTRPKKLAIMETFSGSEINIRNPKLKYINWSVCPINLNDGFDKHVFRDEGYLVVSMAIVEKYIMNIEETLVRIESANTTAYTKVYTKRGVLVKIMMMPYLLHGANRTVIYVTKFNDRLFLTELCNDLSIRTEITDTYHFKFQQHFVSDAPGKTPNTTEPVNENNKLFCIMQSQLRNFNIIYSSEITGIKSNIQLKYPINMQQLDECCFVSTHLFTNHRPWQTTFKAFKIWAQSYLTNVKENYIGIRDEQGYVRNPVDKFSSKHIPKFQFWKPHLAIGFVNKFLNLVSEKMCNVDCPYTVYEFVFEGAKKEICYKVHEGKTEKSFLTENVIDFMRMRSYK